MSSDQALDYDYIIIGSGFGGSVSALRLSEKGYKVLVVEKGKWLKGQDFPETVGELKKWLWLPRFKFFGPFKIAPFRHILAFSGVGVGGGSLVYANTLAMPRRAFFKEQTWAHLADWEKELQGHYRNSLRMLGATQSPRMEVGDMALRELACQLGIESKFRAADVAVYFGEPNTTVPDPYYDGKGPDRAGCVFCARCSMGCRYNAKNTLDKNYLYLAQQHGAKIQAESEVYEVLPLGQENGAQGYRVKWKSSVVGAKTKGEWTGKGIVFAGGVLGTLNLLLELKQSSLPNLSDQVGKAVRTNSESVVAVTTFDRNLRFDEGIAIGAILRTDEHSHLEVARYASNVMFRRLLLVPMAFSRNGLVRILKTFGELIIHPVENLRLLLVDDWGKRTQILLFMQDSDRQLRLTKGRWGLSTRPEKGQTPALLPLELVLLAQRYARIVKGKATVLITEVLFGIPATAHIMGGAVMGLNRDEGVIDRDNRVFGYENMFVCDASMISANLGINPALTITALSERAMSKIPPKAQVQTN